MQAKQLKLFDIFTAHMNEISLVSDTWIFRLTMRYLNLQSHHEINDNNLSTRKQKQIAQFIHQSSKKYIP